MAGRPLHFNAFIWPNGYHESAWRVVDDDVRNVLGLPYYTEIARIAERGLMDSIFLADNIAIAEYRVTHLPQTQFDPISVLSALAAVTSRIGLIGTGSTTYSKPWELARRFATLDHLSGGRAGWNIVTTDTPLAAANFGEPAHPDHADRYARAHEFVEVVTRIWDSWEDDAVIGDRERGVWADRSKLHAPRFHGEHYDVEGVLPFPRSPQGGPCSLRPDSRGPGSGWPRAMPSWPSRAHRRWRPRSPSEPTCTRRPRPPAGSRSGAGAAGVDGDAGRDGGRGPRPGARARGTGERRVPLAERALHHRATSPMPSTPTRRYAGAVQRRAAPSSGADRLYAAARAQPDSALRELAQQLTQGARKSISSARPSSWPTTSSPGRTPAPSTDSRSWARHSPTSWRRSSTTSSRSSRPRPLPN